MATVPEKNCSYCGENVAPPPTAGIATPPPLWGTVAKGLAGAFLPSTAPIKPPAPPVSARQIRPPPGSIKAVTPALSAAFIKGPPQR
jgi:hypothetical protein